MKPPRFTAAPVALPPEGACPPGGGPAAGMKPIRSTAPAGSLLNPDFRYVPSGKTDVARTFARARRVLRQQPWPLTAPAARPKGKETP